MIHSSLLVVTDVSASRHGSEEVLFTTALTTTGTFTTSIQHGVESTTAVPTVAEQLHWPLLDKMWLSAVTGIGSFMAWLPNAASFMCTSMVSAGPVISTVFTTGIASLCWAVHYVIRTFMRGLPVRENVFPRHDLDGPIRTLCLSKAKHVPDFTIGGGVLVGLPYHVALESSQYRGLIKAKATSSHASAWCSALNKYYEFVGAHRAMQHQSSQ